MHVRGDGLYARFAGQLIYYNPATRGQIVYDLTRPGGGIQPFILEFREMGDRLLVVSGSTGQTPAPPNRHSPDPTPPKEWRMYVDLFERATGKPLGRQELSGVKCCISHIAYQTMAGYDTKVVILDGSIVVTDIDGVHVFASEGR